MSEPGIVDRITSTAGNIISAPYRILDTAMWFSPPVLIVMFVNMILIIVIIVKIVNRITESFATGQEKVIMYFRPECGFCEQDMPNFLELAKKYKEGITFEMHDVSQKPVTGIDGVPMYLFILADGSKKTKMGAYGTYEAMNASFRDIFAIDAYEAKKMQEELNKAQAQSQVQAQSQN